MPELTLQQAFELALAHHQAGRLAEAEPIYRQILAVEPNQPESMHYLGVIAHQVGQHDAARELIEKALAIRPAWPEALSNLGEVLRAKGDTEAAAGVFRRAIELAPHFTSALSNLANALNELGCADEALEYSRRAISLDPNIALAWFNLGNALHTKGQLDEALPAAQRALQLDPRSSIAHNLLGVILLDQVQHREAINEFHTAIALDPKFSYAYSNLGVALEALGQYDEAVAACHRAIELQPRYFQAWYNLGNALHAKSQYAEAIAAFRHAIELNPDVMAAHCNLGNTFQAQGEYDLAITQFRRAIEIDPSFAEAYNNLGNILRNKGEHDAALAAHRQAIDLCRDEDETPHSSGQLLVVNQDDEALVAAEPASPVKTVMAAAQREQDKDLSGKSQLKKTSIVFNKEIPGESKKSITHSNYIFDLLYHPDSTEALIAAELRNWDREFAEPLRSAIQPHTNDRSVNRRLRIGYVSPDLRIHPIGYFLEPLLANHDRENFEIFAYAQVPVADAMTERLRAQTDTWRSTIGLTDAQVVEQIRADQIDILVDLAMHTANNRLLVFASKPAPVQVNYLAYVGSSGLSTMDYRFSDSYLDPPGMDESIYSERTLRLPGTYWCYSATEMVDLPAVQEIERDSIRFGCLNNFCKINTSLVALWSKILQAVPRARLLIHAYQGDHRQTLLDRFAQLGISAERVEFVGRMRRENYFQTYQSLDITLDTTPYAGGTTTCDSLWMGVPVVTLAGERAVGRGGVSILNNVGLPELIAQTPEEYVRIAVELAHDLPRLRNLQATLRERMRASPLMDAPKYARNIETVYRQMWRTWCEQR